MSQEKSEDERGFPGDGEETAPFPAGLGERDGPPDADSWVAQWSDLFEDRPAPGTQPPTTEMPVYRPEQPPLTEPGSEPERIPGHPDPTGTARRRSPRPARSDTDAAEIAA